jgi:hypothetical protein
MSDITLIDDSEQSSLVTNGIVKNGELYLKKAGSTSAGAIVAYDNGVWRTFANEASSSAPIISTNLIWHFDAGDSSSYSGSGTTWTNLISSGPDAELVNGASYSSDGGGSIAFDGSNDKVQIGSYTAPYTDVILPNPCTVEFWVAVEGSETLTQTLLAHISYNNGGYFPRLTYNATQGSLVMASNGGYGTVFGYHFPRDGTFERLTFTRNNATVEGFLNGVSKGTANINASNDLIASTLGAFISGADPLTGKLAEFNVYSSVLSSTDIETNFDNTKARYGY